MMFDVQRISSALADTRSILLVVLMCIYSVRCAPVPSVLMPGPTGQCNAQNRDPCVTFPDLCSAGGGRCVVKAPCEYQCVCPPDGRIGRDCTSSPNPQPGSVVDTLLIFPKDIFLDVNHVDKSQEFGAGPNLSNVSTTSTMAPQASAITEPTTSPWKQTDKTSTQNPASLTSTLQSSSDVDPSHPPLGGTTIFPLTTKANDIKSADLVIPGQSDTWRVSETAINNSTSTVQNRIPQSSPGQQSHDHQLSNIQETTKRPLSVSTLPVEVIDLHPKQSGHSGHSSLDSSTPLPPGESSPGNTDLTSSGAAQKGDGHVPSKLNTSMPHFLQGSSTGKPVTDTKQTTIHLTSPSTPMTTSSPIVHNILSTQTERPVVLNSDSTIQTSIPPNLHDIFTTPHHTTDFPHPQTTTPHITGLPQPQSTTPHTTELPQSQSTPPHTTELTQSQSTTPHTTELSQPQSTTLHTTELPHHQTTTPHTTGLAYSQTTTTTHFQPSTQDSGVTNQTNVSSKAPNSNAPSAAGSEEFPTLFKVTLDNSPSQSEQGVNAALSMVVHRVFVPKEKFESVMRPRGP